ncbi:MAG: CBS domain-containing protein [Deltaproteobacteria bacterium]|jgi:CBS domain-containing protein|nr:CBS domain-containing protein [Deltaproteobacteria bacterium]
MLARDIMETRFHTLRPDETVAQAVKMFQTAGRVEGKKIFGLIVVGDGERLVGMLSMYDILLFIQPKHMKILGEMADLEADRLFEDLLGRVKDIRVGDIMTTQVVTIGPETHILSISELMINKHIRRLPVSEGGRIVGIVYISDVFYHMLKKFLD